jgi:hypothetical protein
MDGMKEGREGERRKGRKEEAGSEGRKEDLQVTTFSVKIFLPLPTFRET